MASSLYFLIYVSRVSQAMSHSDLKALHQSVRAFNRSVGISGCLVHQDGYLMQMLEGKREVVEALMVKIKADPRHHDVRTVIEGPTRRRVFTDWGMVLRDLQSGMDGADCPDFTPWQRRELNFFDLADDARTCYAYITAYQAAELRMA